MEVLQQPVLAAAGFAGEVHIWTVGPGLVHQDHVGYGCWRNPEALPGTISRWGWTIEGEAPEGIFGLLDMERWEALCLPSMPLPAHMLPLWRQSPEVRMHALWGGALDAFHPSLDKSTVSSVLLSSLCSV